MASGSFMGNLGSKGGLTGALGFQYNNNQNELGLTGNNRSLESGSLLSGYQGMVNGGGYSPAEKASIEQGTLGNINNSYNAAADQTARRAAVTNNAAGTNSALGSLARSKARDLGNAGLQVQSQFANEAFNRKMAGLQGLAQMYGVDTSFVNALNQNQLGILGIGNSVQSRSRGVLGSIGAGLGLASQALHL